MKAFVDVIALALALPAAALCWLEEALNPGGEGAFGFWAHLLALLPGHVGVFIRRAFYRLTLDSCDERMHIGFGSFFAHRHAVVERDVYIGSYAVLGSVTLRSGCLVGTRASLTSGSAQHAQQADGRWTSDGSMFRSTEIGRNTWIGESATVMADVGPGAIVSAGAVVSTPVPAGAVVAGNPARFVRHSQPVDTAAETTAEPAARSAYLPFLDWLKCLGMAIIVYGHVTGGMPLVRMPPILLKQFGVAMFLFATAYSLTTERRKPWRVALNRLFPIYLYGIPIAVLLSVLAYPSLHRVLVSNYVPFIGGANVVFDFFPANPTSWFVGTYIHIILLWVVAIRFVRVTPRTLLAACLAEIVVRAVLMQTAGLFVAYMLFTNWTTAFLLGVAAARQSRPLRLSRSEAVPAAAMLVLALAAWATVAARLPLEEGFPFMQLHLRWPFVGALVVSVMITTLYTSVTLTTIAITQALPAPNVVRFFARNTLIVFLAHMPLYYAVAPWVVVHVADRRARGVILFVLCMPGLALVSEALHRVIRPEALREKLFKRSRVDQLPDPV